MKPLRVVATKWGDQPHWEFDAMLLGDDEHGTWAGLPVGTVIERPGARVVTQQLQVVLFPRSRWCVSTFYEESEDPPCQVYVDIATVPVVTDGLVSSVDLDLDVLLGWSGRVWVDDEDEFADHRVRWQYPDAVVDAAVTTCQAVELALTERTAPYDGTHLVWLEQLRGSTLKT